MKKLFYIRHGETEHNFNAMWAGRVETPLTKKGIKQAKEAGKTLGKSDLKIDLIICSPLSRALDTAKHVAKEIGYPVEKIQINDLFIERSFGEMEGKSWTKFMKEYPLEHMDRVDGAETIADLDARARKALEYVKSLPEDNILVVGHGSFGRAFIRVVNKLPHHLEYDDKHREKHAIKNGQIVELI